MKRVTSVLEHCQDPVGRWLTEDEPKWDVHSTVEALLDLALIGDVKEHQRDLTVLTQSDGIYKPFAIKHGQLAREFNLNNLRDILQGYLAEISEQ